MFLTPRLAADPQGVVQGVHLVDGEDVDGGQEGEDACIVSRHLSQWESRLTVPTAHRMYSVGPRTWGAWRVWGAAVDLLAVHCFLLASWVYFHHM